MHAKSLQSCLTLCDPMDCSPPGSFVLGIPQARILERAAMPSSMGSSRPRDQTQVSCSCGTAAGCFTLSHRGRPGYDPSFPQFRNWCGEGAVGAVGDRGPCNPSGQGDLSKVTQQRGGWKSALSSCGPGQVRPARPAFAR